MFEHRPSVTGPKTDYEELLELLDPPGWHADGLCQEYPGLDWFADDRAGVEAARAVCGRCLVQSECRDYAVSRADLQGVWGGMTEGARRTVRRRKAA